MGNNPKGKDKDKDKQEMPDNTTEHDTESEKYLIPELEMEGQFKHRYNRGADAYSKSKQPIDPKLAANRNYPYLNNNEVKQHFKDANTELKDPIHYAPNIAVFRATQGDRLLAIKFVDLCSMKDTDKFHQTNAYHTRAVLSHPRIIYSYYQGKLENRLFVYAMEYASKGTLEDMLRDNGAFAEKLAMNMFFEIIKAVQYLHKKGIAHRNIILEHVLVTKRNIPKLTGFKFAIPFNGVNLIDKHVGVGSYLPPEVLSRQPYDPFKADVWSLGVVLFALTNDGFPFHRVVSDQVNNSGPH